MSDEMLRRRLILWFFRDLNDEQRMALFKLAFYPAYKDGVGIPTMAEQNALLNRVMDNV